MTKIREDRQIFSTIILFVLNKNVTTKFASFHTINSSNCIIQIVIKQNFANFIPIISINAITKIFVPSHTPRTKSSKILSLFTSSNGIQIFIYTSSRRFGVRLLKTMREISVPMPTIFRTSEEIQRSMSTNRLGVSFGTSRIKSSPFKELDARWVWIAKNVMAGWSRDTILPNTTQKEVSH